MNKKIKLTNCCNSYSTYHDDVLICKTCYQEVEVGEGDGTKYDECYDCKDEYETPLVKKGDKYLCKDCLMMKDLQKEFADSPFALIVK